MTARVPGLRASDALEPLREAFLDPSVWRVPGDVRPALDELRGAGARMAVVSNWDSRLPRLLERGGFQSSRFGGAPAASQLAGSHGKMQNGMVGQDLLTAIRSFRTLGRSR